MAKKAKGDRVQVILECTEQKGTGVPGTQGQRYARHVALHHDQEPQEHY